MYDRASTQEWHRHDRTATMIVTVIVIAFSALGVLLAR